MLGVLLSGWGFYVKTELEIDFLTRLADAIVAFAERCLYLDAICGY